MDIVVGGLGFIGRVLTAELVSKGHDVFIIDIDVWNNLEDGPKNSKLEVFKPSGAKWAEQAFQAVPKVNDYTIWHLGANSDISKGARDYSVDYELTLGSTIEVVKLSQLLNVSKIHFTSSSAVYGEGKIGKLFSEDDPCMPISNYGVSKLASEMIFRNFASNSGMSIYIYRLANIIGPGMTHGVIYDFKKKLEANPITLSVLGDGNQTKSYLHVLDLVKIMMHFNKLARDSFTLNTGSGDSGVSVKEIAQLVCAKISPNASIEVQQLDRGWIGDAPISLLNTEKLQQLYEFSVLTSRQAITETLN